MNDIRALVELQEQAKLRTLMVRSLRESTYSVRNLPNTGPVSPTAFAVARQETADICDAAAQGLRSELQLAAARNNLLRTFDAVFIERLMYIAESASDPVEGAIYAVSSPTG